ncbi:MAG: UTP--glucose-1-phosphate uridylyltransferase [Chlamydiia bacterium]|nr:UTP--glucose-1-phosphate uridylyltransferase [Chlamydiia bacterium]
MFRTIRRLFLPNPLDWMLKRMASRGGTKILLGWNRGLGDIPLGLYAIVQRIRQYIPEAEITFLIRENLREGFSMLEGIKILVAPDWKRGQAYSAKESLKSLGIDPKAFDLVIERPSPNDWVRKSRGTLTPRLKWDASYDALATSFSLPEGFLYIGVQLCAETNHGSWRNWPVEQWHELLSRLAKMPHVKVLLFGYGKEPEITYPNVIDLRGKTTLFELLSVIKNRCHAVVLPDSGILSMLYYLDVSFPLQVISLWTDCEGVLKQGVFSPNRELIHRPLIGQRRDPTTIASYTVLQELFPAKPLLRCQQAAHVKLRPVENVGVILLAGGQGSRLGFAGPKGLFPIQGKSLFQWICDKVDPHIPIAVMTAPCNHEATVSFFQKNGFFGKEIHFFQQGTLLMRDAKRRPLDITAPDGNGSVFKAFEQAGLNQLFAAKGIRHISVVPVENPLADPVDPSLISWALETGADAVIKCMEVEAGERAGVLIEREGRCEILEYTECYRNDLQNRFLAASGLPQNSQAHSGLAFRQGSLAPHTKPEDLPCQNPDSSSRFGIDAYEAYKYAYTGMMILSPSLMKQAAQIDLPLHWVWKQIGVYFGKKKFAWKGERFIFDLLPFANRVEALCFPRAEIYAPLKEPGNLRQIEQKLMHKSYII